MIQNVHMMHSPITGGAVSMHWEWREMDFRKEKYRVMFPYYRCEDTGEQFTTTDSDGIWYAQLHNQYCHKYGIPYIDEIIDIRKRYGVSAAKMSEILGFGPNQWRKYEQEEIPSVSNGKMMRSIMNPNVFLDMVESSKEILTSKDYIKITSRIKQILAEAENNSFDIFETKRIYFYTRAIENGFGQISLVRLKNILLYILENCKDVWYTKMNKLLFYTDFVSYRELGKSMSGLCYRAIDYGPVPERWERIYSQFSEISQEPHFIGDYEGIMLIAETAADNTVFTEEELSILQNVCTCFGNCTSNELTDISHKEPAWINYHKDHKLIPYSEAFFLKGI